MMRLPSWRTFICKKTLLSPSQDLFVAARQLQRSVLCKLRSSEQLTVHVNLAFNIRSAGEDAPCCAKSSTLSACCYARAAGLNVHPPMRASSRHIPADTALQTVGEVCAALEDFSWPFSPCWDGPKPVTRAHLRLCEGFFLLAL